MQRVTSAAPLKPRRESLHQPINEDSQAMRDMARLRINDVERVRRRPPRLQDFHQRTVVDRGFGRIAKGLHDPQARQTGGQVGIALVDAEAHFDRIFGNNVRGVLFTVQKALPLLTDGASIILTSSTVSVQGTANFSVYSASKAAVRNFARSWVMDLKDRGIRVNVVSPGPIRTPGLGGLASDETRQGLFDFLAAQVPLGRLGEPSEVGKAVAFLASDAASFINGIELFVDGGMAQV